MIISKVVHVHVLSISSAQHSLIKGIANEPDGCCRLVIGLPLVQFIRQRASVSELITDSNSSGEERIVRLT